MAVDCSEFEGELPQVENELIPLSHLVERVTAQAYNDLAALAETLPSAADDKRKRLMVDYALQTRRQLLKLLVLVRWSERAQGVTKSMNIIGFLGRQNWEFEHTVHQLTETKAMLASARMRNYDLPTALSVLTSGTYTRLPTALTDAFKKAPTLSDELALRTLAEVDEVLRWRLGAVERIPPQMSRQGWTVADGRARFRIAGMWEATFTYGGDNDDNEAEWYLLSLEFLFKVRDARGVWSSVPIGPMKEHIIELCNRELAWRRTPPADTSADPPTSQPPVPGDAPLVRGYNFIQRLALRYQLEAISSHAARLAATSWAGHLKADKSADGSQLTIEYWPKPTPPPLPPNQQQPQPTTLLSGKLIISLSPPADPKPALSQSAASTSAARPSASSGSAREHAFEQMLARISQVSPTDSDGQLSEQTAKAEEGEGVAERLRVVWIADEVTEREWAGVSLELDEQLDVEAVLERVTAVHARAGLHHLHEQLVSELGGADLELVDKRRAGAADSAEEIRVHLHAAHFIRLSYPPRTGRLELLAEGEVGLAREQRLRAAADKIDRDRPAAAETLLRVRASTILDEVDSRAAYLGLHTLRRLPLRDVSKFGTSTRSVLFVRLPRLAMHYLVLVLDEQAFKFALVSVRDAGDSSGAWLAIDEIGWLDKARICGTATATATAPSSSSKGKRKQREEGDGARAESSGFEVTIDELREMHAYCTHRIASFKIEQQLHARRIPYRTVGPHKLDSAKARAPFLVVHSRDLLPQTAALAQEKPIAWPNLAIQCSILDGGDDADPAIRTTLHVRFRELGLAPPDPRKLPPSVRVDAHTGVVVFMCDELDRAVEVFLKAFALVVRAVVMARHRRAQDGKKGAPAGAGARVEAEAAAVVAVKQ